MRFSETYKVCWHDTDAGRVIRPTRMLTYLEETANHQCASFGKDLDLMRDEDQMGFILTRIELRAHALLRKGDEIRVDTWVSDVKGFSTCREFSVYQGDRCVWEGSSIWALVRVDTHALCKMEDYPYPYPREEGHDYKPPMRLQMEGLEVVGTYPVSYAVTDYNGHMNNTFYPDVVMNFLPSDVARDFYPERIVILFHNGVPGGQILTIRRGTDAENPDAYLFSAEGEDGKMCFQARLDMKKRTDFEQIG